MENKIIEFNKRFCDGEQYIDIIKKHTNECEIEEEGKQYFWQERLTFNHIRPLVDLIKLKIPEITTEDLYGEFGFVGYLIPLQKAYNAVKNRKHELLNRISMGILTVEDGSVDTDNLKEEGLMPGKILIYRQGCQVPKNLSIDITDIKPYNESENELLKNFTEYYNHFYEFFKEKYKGDKE
jgi:hypothetical protein